MPEKNTDKTIHISFATHDKMVKHLKEDGEGRDIGKFADRAIDEKIEKEKKEKK